VVPEVVREISELDQAREAAVCQSLDVFGVRNRPVVSQEQNRANDTLAESEFIQFGDIDRRVFENVTKQSNDLLVALALSGSAVLRIDDRGRLGDLLPAGDMPFRLGFAGQGKGEQCADYQGAGTDDECAVVAGRG
jgi:hypothetical protein